uniref:Uncharacterized protein n=1 Tax=Apteryx owenii TaxID=8824 RepID=A0A8B9P6R3_APTOW
CVILAARKLQQKRSLLLEEEGEEEEMVKQAPDMSLQSSVIIEGVEYKIERLNGRSIQAPPKLNGVTRSDCECRVLSSRVARRRNFLQQSVVLWRQKNEQCGGQHGEIEESSLFSSVG